jgi:hypothetical protein
VAKPEEAAVEVTEETPETVEPGPVDEEPEEKKDQDAPAPETRRYEDEGEL